MKKRVNKSFKLYGMILAAAFTMYSCGGESGLTAGGSTTLTAGVVADGETLFGTSCSGCHHSDASGGKSLNAPNIRGASAEMVKTMATLGGGDMPVINASLTDQNAADIASYLALYGSTITVTGTLSGGTSKPGTGQGNRLAVDSWDGASVQVVDTRGVVIGSSTADSTGSFTVSSKFEQNMIVRVSIGNLVLKAFSSSTDSERTINVNATTSAVVKILANLLGVADMGDSGNANEFDSAIKSSLDFAGNLAEATTYSTLSTIATAIAADVSANYDATATTAAVGSAGTGGDTQAIAAGLDISSVLTTEEQAGVDFFSENCAGCHGSTASGGLCPNLHQDTIELLSTVPQSGSMMGARFDLTTDEINNIYAWLQTLS